MRYKAGVVLILLAASAIVIVQSIPPTALGFYLEQELAADHASSVSIALDGFSDCNISIAFSEGLGLLYSLDIRLRRPATFSSAIQIVENEGSVSFIAVYGNSQLVSHAILVLNPDIPYTIAIINGLGIEADVEYSNGANLTGASFDFYESTGMLSFEMDSSVVHTSDDVFYMRVGQGGDIWPEVLDIDVILPSEIYGWIYFQAEEELTPNSVDGWVIVEEHVCINLDVYGTGWPPFDPQVKFRTRADFLSFSLNWI